MDGQLPQRIIDKILNYGDEEQCWPWQGAKTKKQLVKKLHRDRGMRPFYAPAMTQSYGIVKYKGKNIVVHKLVYEFLAARFLQLTNYRLMNECRDTTCCNPRHWRLIDHSPPSTPFEMPQEDTFEVCLEMLESTLCKITPNNFSEVRNYPLLLDFTDEMIQEALIKIRKPHLCQ